MRKALWIVVVALLAAAPALAADAKRDDQAAEKLGWKLGVQCWSFNRYTFFEAVEKSKALGLKYVEAFGGQRLGKDLPGDVKFGPGMSDEHMKLARKKLADAGITVQALGVIGLGKDEAASRKVFDFAKAMGIGTINSEPAFDAFDTVEKLCKEYNIKVGLHNHPKNSLYWNPDTVLQQIKGRSKLIGACADTGHWMRSGVDPIEALKKLQGRIVSFHFKDLNVSGTPQGAHDVPWGEGKGNAKAVFAEMKRQGFAGAISIEYEHNWTNSMPDMAKCIAFLDKTAAQLVKDSK